MSLPADEAATRSKVVRKLCFLAGHAQGRRCPCTGTSYDQTTARSVQPPIRPIVGCFNVLQNDALVHEAEK